MIKHNVIESNERDREIGGGMNVIGIERVRERESERRQKMSQVNAGRKAVAEFLLGTWSCHKKVIILRNSCGR